MRSLVVAAVMLSAACVAAEAADLADLPILRGSVSDGLSSSRVNWTGFYVGAQGGYGSSDSNFTDSGGGQLSSLLANSILQSQVSSWNPAFGRQWSRSAGWGAFGGYNAQWDDVVLGVEGSYLHGSYGVTATSNRAFSTAAALSDGNFHRGTTSQSSQFSVSDMATIRGRAGYVMGCFLPYAFFGLALGNADIGQSATVTDSASATSGGAILSTTTLNANNIRHDQLIYGYSAGLGVDVNLVGGLFARAEYEYVRFSSKVDTSVNTARLGLGYKF